MYSRTKQTHTHADHSWLKDKVRESAGELITEV